MQKAQAKYNYITMWNCTIEDIINKLQWQATDTVRRYFQHIIDSDLVLGFTVSKTPTTNKKKTNKKKIYIKSNSQNIYKHSLVVGYLWGERKRRNTSTKRLLMSYFFNKNQWKRSDANSKFLYLLRVIRLFSLFHLLFKHFQHF